MTKTSPPTETSTSSHPAPQHRSRKWLLLVSAVYAVWLIWLAYVAWVNIQSGNQ